MGYGDEVVATGLARGMHASGMRAAFGDGYRIIWGPWCAEVFLHNPNIAIPGSEGSSDLFWIRHHNGHRLYNTLDRARSRWVWNYGFRVRPGEIYKLSSSDDVGRDFVYVEPNVPWHKTVAPNKDWGLKNYQAVVDLLLRDGHDVVQSKTGRDKLRGVRFVSTPTFRDALAVMSGAKAALVPEGGMHHGAAAVGVSAVVLFGGFIPPAVMGYDTHVNLTGGVEACGSISPCRHCRDAMSRISVEEVYQSIKRFL